MYLHREADQFKSKADPCALARCNTNWRGNGIEHREHNGSQDSQRGNLVQRQGALRDKDRSSGDHETFNQIFNDAVDDFSESVTRHVSIIKPKKKTHTRLNYSESKAHGSSIS